MCQRLGRAVASSHTDSLGEDLLQLRGRSASYQRPYQRQRVIVKVRLQRSHQATRRTVSQIASQRQKSVFVKTT